MGEVTRLAVLSDCHLGYRAHHRAAPSGANQRELDVANAFRAAVDAILLARPDIVLIGGDLFHEPKPANMAIRFAFDQFERLRSAGIPVVLAAGNHDSPRRAETGWILPHFERCGVQVATTEARQFVYPALDLRVVALPHQAVMLGEIPPVEGSERFRILLAHAEVQGVYSKAGDRPSGQIPAALLAQDWSAVCLGDYHKMHRVGDGVWYSGSTEFTSSNPWEEIDTPKAWLLWDLETGTVEPQLIPQCRAIYDLPEINAADLTADQVSALIAERVNAVDITDALVRLKVINMSVQVSRGLCHADIRRWKALALHLNLDVRRPEIIHSPAVSAYLAMRSRPLGEIYAEHLEKYDLTPGLESGRGRFLALGAEIMAEAVTAETEQRVRGAA